MPPRLVDAPSVLRGARSLVTAPAPPPLPAEHRHTLELLTASGAERAALTDRADGLLQASARVAQELAALPRWRRGRRSELSHQLHKVDAELTATTARLNELERHIPELQRQAAAETAHRGVQQRTHPGGLTPPGRQRRQPRELPPDERLDRRLMLAELARQAKPPRPVPSHPPAPAPVPPRRGIRP
jgi:septal ring factor EnvC (AmiA/AmiB activator)